MVPQVLPKQAENQQNKEGSDGRTNGTPRGGVSECFRSGEGEARKFFDEIRHGVGSIEGCEISFGGGNDVSQFLNGCVQSPNTGTARLCRTHVAYRSSTSPSLSDMHHRSQRIVGSLRHTVENQLSPLVLRLYFSAKGRKNKRRRSHKRWGLNYILDGTFMVYSIERCEISVRIPWSVESLECRRHALPLEYGGLLLR